MNAKKAPVKKVSAKKTTAKKSAAKKATENKAENHAFQADVSRLLYLVTNALYSEKEIFLRELISNSADACDKRRYHAIKNPELCDEELEIAIIANKDDKTLTITDNGIGMSHQELIDNLGTIARSGTREFMDKLSQSKDSNEKQNLIGQFGVGFYSAFMVAAKVDVISKQPQSNEVWQWSSNGQGTYDISIGDSDKIGTQVILHLHDDDHEYLERSRLQHIIKTYSDHVSFPIHLLTGDDQDEDNDPVNEAGALWTRNKSDITEEQYHEFYRQSSKAFDKPWSINHFRVEGTIAYSALLFIPESAPFDLFNPDRKSQIKLYVNKVFITDDCDEIIPSWLRFVKGIVDSEDLPLNVSREMLQNQPILKQIKKGVVSRILTDVEKRLASFIEGEDNGFDEFWKNFGAVIKEGIYEDNDNRQRILKLSRFESLNQGSIIGLDDYINNMRDGQENIYYITGENRKSVENSPQCEGFRAKNVDVLFLTDPVDEFWLSMATEYEGKKFQSVTRAGNELDSIDNNDDTSSTKKDKKNKDDSKNYDALIERIKDTLGDTVTDVRVSKRLTTSAVCLVADEAGLDMHIERVLRAHKQLDQASKRILEINPNHDVFVSMAKNNDADHSDIIQLLYDQALIQEGEPPRNLTEFSHRLCKTLAASL